MSQSTPKQPAFIVPVELEQLLADPFIPVELRYNGRICIQIQLSTFKLLNQEKEAEQYVLAEIKALQELIAERRLEKEQEDQAAEATRIALEKANSFGAKVVRSMLTSAKLLVGPIVILGGRYLLLRHGIHL